MNGQASASTGVILSNRFASINLTQDSIQVIGWYTPPWIASLLTPVLPIVSLALLWILLRPIYPPLARYLAPGIDRPLEKYINLFKSPIHVWLGKNDWDFGGEMTVSLLLGSLAAMFVLAVASVLLLERGWAMRGLAFFIRFPLRVEMWRDRIRVGRKVHQKTGDETFSLSQTSAVRNNRLRNRAYDQSVSIIFETDIANTTLANVFGIEPAEGIVLALRRAMTLSESL